MTKEWLKEISNWESEYLTMDVHITKREKELLEGAEIKSNEGMMYRRMYADWKRQKGYDINTSKSVTSDEDIP